MLRCRKRGFLPQIDVIENDLSYIKDKRNHNRKPQHNRENHKIQTKNEKYR